VARKKESAVLDNAATVICTLNKSLRFKSASKILEKVWQYSASELKGMSVLSTVTEQTAASTRAQFAAISSAGDGQRGEIENIVRCKDGTLKNALWTVRWSELDATFFCVVHDISRLRATQDFRRQFLGMVGHDLRSPLSSIAVSLTGLLSEKKGAIPKEAQSVLADMNIRTTKVVDLIGEFLDLERLLARKVQFNEECVSVYDLCKEAMARAEPIAKAAQIELVRPIGDAAVLGDSEKLTQCIFGLLTTLIGLATQKSSINLQLARSLKDIEVRATSPSLYLQPAEQEQVFNRLGLIEAASGAKTSGLSLMLAREIIEAQGGRFGSSSTSSDGTCLWIALPEFNDGEEDLP
jgi:PAS domain S-box-containing protein